MAISTVAADKFASRVTSGLFRKLSRYSGVSATQRVSQMWHICLGVIGIEPNATRMPIYEGQGD